MPAATTAMRQLLTTERRNHICLLTLLSLDLLLEILYKLPVKSLMKLKCVSKYLNSIISDPKFAKDHLRLSHTRDYHLVICSPNFISNRKWNLILGKEFYFIDSSLPYVLNNKTTAIPDTNPLRANGNILAIIEDSCDGIICFSTRDYNYENFKLVVWNPCTRKFKILPHLENLPYSSASTTIKYNIVYDHFTGNYKVVLVISYEYHMLSNFGKIQVRVHTLGTNFWRRIPDFPSDIMGKLKGCAGKLSGTVNWVIQRYHENGFSFVILSLDLGNESYQEILQPNYELDKPLRCLRVGVSRDCLCVLAHTNTFLDIWAMKDYGNKDSWTKLFTIPLVEFHNPDIYANLLYIYEEGDQVLLQICYKPFVYNYKNGTIKCLDIQGLPSTLFDSHVYVESLISP